MTEAEYRSHLNDIEMRLSRLYQERRKLTERFADEHPPELPPARYRTDAQARVARCPRCSALLSEKGGLEK